MQQKLSRRSRWGVCIKNNQNFDSPSHLYDCFM